VVNRARQVKAAMNRSRGVRGEIGVFIWAHVVTKVRI
jgi:hypothetical protein